MKKQKRRKDKFGINELIVFVLLICSAICVIFLLISDSEEVSVIFGAITVILSIGTFLTSTRFDKAKKSIVCIMFVIIVIGIVGEVIKISIYRDETIRDSMKTSDSLSGGNKNDDRDTEIKDEENDNDESNIEMKKSDDAEIDIAEKENQSVKENRGKENEQLKWEEDIFMTNASENIVELLRNWSNNQTYEDTGLISQQELNDGKYGKLIYNAQKYYRDYQKSKMEDVKLFALDRGIELRKQADSISETCENMKELGTWLLQRSRLAKGEGNSETTDNTELMEQAIKYYIKALSMACASGRKKYSEVLWKNLAYAYELWYMSGERDEALKRKAKIISNACLKLSE